MDDLAIIDRFTETFSRYIDSGFGLLAGDVAFLTSILVAIDITLAGLFWALMGDDNVVAQLIRKVLYVGFFALLLNNFKGLADIIFQSFAGLGLKASGASLTAADLMRPGFVASTGFTASRPLLEKAGELIGITTFFSNFVTIAVLMLAWVIVLLAFFVLSVQLFITIIEFKLTVLAGFVLVPFALFGHTAFLAERVLGNVIASGIKLMVLAIVVGIGATLFGTLDSPDRRDHADAGGVHHPGRHRRVWSRRLRAGHGRRPRIGRAAAGCRFRGGHHGRTRRHRRCRRHARGRRRPVGWPCRRRHHQSSRRTDRPGWSCLRDRRTAWRGPHHAQRAGIARVGVLRRPRARCLQAGCRPGLPRCGTRIRCRRSARRIHAPVAGRPGALRDGRRAWRGGNAPRRPGWWQRKLCARATAQPPAADLISKTKAEGE